MFLLNTKWFQAKIYVVCRLSMSIYVSVVWKRAVANDNAWHFSDLCISYHPSQSESCIIR